MENENITKAGRGRPFKMNTWLEELKVVLDTENILFLSDKDLQFMVNRNLPEADRITDRTFENWKAGKFHQDETLGKEFIECIQYSLIKQKQYLSKKMIDDDKNWQRYAWIMERKFTEWNLKHISEKITRQEQSLTLNITARDESQKKLIDSIINADYTTLEPLKIETQKPILSNNESEDYGF